MVISQEEYDKHRKKKIKIEDSDTPSTEIPKDIYGIVPSSNHYGYYYLISGEENNLICSCPASVECKHLKDIKNGKGTCLRISGSVQEKV